MTATLEFNAQTLQLRGVVDFNNAEAIYQQGLTWLKQQSAAQLRFDLSGLQSGNTITLAVLMQWLRQLKATQQAQIVHAPSQLQAIMHASSLERLLA
jgi:phospholipid transport system transporter-binding protein